MNNKINSALDFQQAALGLRARRQEVLAGNIANADTPNYKARDFDFSSALKEAVAGRMPNDLSMKLTSQRHIAGTAVGDGLPSSLMYRVPVQMNADGNTVEMDTERSQFSENAIRYQAGVSFISGHLRTLMSAIQGQ